jgi:acetylornithine/succinyldiaminopimelate/putrescine aminotransferase
MGGGVPTAAIIATGAIADAAIARGFIQAASHRGDPFQCATAIANIDVIEDEGLPRTRRRWAHGSGQVSTRSSLST